MALRLLCRDVANPQSFVGINDVPPIVANYDILLHSIEGSGTETLRISILTYSQAPIYQCFHLSPFYGYNILGEWGWGRSFRSTWQAVR